MLHNSFLITNKNLTIKLDKNQKEKLSLLFKHYNVGNYIYPGVLIRELNIDMYAAYDILGILEKAGFLQELYEVYCPNESKSTGILYENLLDLLGDEVVQSCPECGGKINIQEDNILIFKVLKKVNMVYE